MAPRLKRSPPEEPKTELVQLRLSKKVRALLETKAKSEALSVASHVRRLVYRDLGLIEKEA